MHSEAELAEIRASLLAWYEIHKRDLPWRRTKDPYAVWVSEAMLQQTRVTAVLPYYERFLNRFPSFEALANAPEADVLAQWAGLGYYYRARNLQKAARRMVEEGGFPSIYEGIRALPGVGDYTAAAVGSIAFGLPYAVVDGNVFRVLSRVFADGTDIASGAGRKHFAALANQLLDRERPAAFNQAVMELGATVCLPKNPQCLLCPIAAKCAARRAGTQNQFPVKLVQQRSVKQDRTLFWIEQGESVLAWQRPEGARLMPGFWELPEAAQLPAAEPGMVLGSFRHGITIHSYTFSVVRATVPAEYHPCAWLPLSSLEMAPVSTVFRKAVKVVARKHRRTRTVAF